MKVILCELVCERGEEGVPLSIYEKEEGIRKNGSDRTFIEGEGEVSAGSTLYQLQIMS